MAIGRFYFSALILLLFTASLSGAGTLNSFLLNYMPNSTIANYSISNQSIGSDTYAVMAGPDGKYMVVNTTGSNYRLVSDTETAYSVLRPFLISRYYPSSAILGEMNSMMGSFVNRSLPNINDCLLETGLDINASPVINGGYFACSSIPNCRKALYATGGPTGPLGEGIVNFSVQYRHYNDSYHNYFSLLDGMNTSNAAGNIGGISSDVANITALADTMWKNPLFPIPTNFSSSQFTVCPNYLPANAPWFCVDLGYCRYLRFNYTTLYSISQLAAQLKSLPISNASMQAISVNSTVLAGSYIRALQVRVNGSELKSFLATEYPIYNLTLENSAAVLNDTGNSTLAASVASLKSTFASILEAGVNQSVANASATMNTLVGNVAAISAKAGKGYDALYSLSMNNTALILLHEMDYRNGSGMPLRLVQLAGEQQRINLMLESHSINASQMASETASANAISSQLATIGTPFSFAVLDRSLFGGIAGKLLGSPAMPVYLKEALAPIAVALIVFSIGLVLFILFYLWARSRVMNKKIHHRYPGVARAWRIVAFLLLLAVLLATYASYSFAYNANAFLPPSAFFNALGQHKSAYIAFNGTESYNGSVIDCAAQLKASMASAGISANEISIDNGACSAANSTAVAGGAGCYNSLLQEGIPIIYFGDTQGLGYSGIYGDELHVGGAFASYPQCFAARMVSAR